MLRFLKMFAHSLRVAGVVVTADILIAYGTTFLGLSFAEVAGDLMLVEAAVFFLWGGLIDFSSSMKGADLRKALGMAFGHKRSSRDEYSVSVRKEAENRVAVLFLAGGMLLIMLVVVAVLTNL